MVRVGHLSAKHHAPVLAERPGDGVLVEHHLDTVSRARPAGLDVDDGGVIPPLGDEVGLAGQRGGAASQVESVLPLGEDGVALPFPFRSLLVELGRVVHQPLGLVEVARHP